MQNNQLRIISILCILTGSLLFTLSFQGNAEIKEYNPSQNTNKIVNSITKTEIEQNIESADQSYKDKINQGLNYFINQDYRLAISHFVQANKLDNTQALPFLLSAECYLNLDKPELAKKNIYAAQFKENYGLYGQLIELQSYIYNRENTQAQNLLASLDPNFAEIQFWTAIFALNTFDLDSAKKHFDILANSPDNNPYYHIALSFKYNFELFNTFRDSKEGFLQTLTAKNLLNHNQIVASRLLSYTALKQNPLFRDAWLSLGYSFVKSREYTKALKTLDKTRKLDPYYPETHLYLGIAYYNINKYENAIRHLKLANNQKSKNAELIQEFLGLSYFKTQNNQAQAIFEQLISENYFTPNTLSSLTQIYLNQNQLDQAASILQIFKQHFASHELFSHNLGHLYFLTKNYKKSIQHLQTATLINPTAASSYYLLAQNFRAIKDNSQYTQNINQALELATKQKNQSLYSLILKEINNG